MKVIMSNLNSPDSNVDHQEVTSAAEVDNINTRHQRRMQRKKALMDEKSIRHNGQPAYC